MLTVPKLDELPFNCQTRIFEYLSTYDQLIARQVCQRWKLLISSLITEFYISVPKTDLSLNYFSIFPNISYLTYVDLSDDLLSDLSGDPLDNIFSNVLRISLNSSENDENDKPSDENDKPSDESIKKSFPIDLSNYQKLETLQITSSDSEFHWLAGVTCQNLIWKSSENLRYMCLASLFHHVELTPSIQTLTLINKSAWCQDCLALYGGMIHLRQISFEFCDQMSLGQLRQISELPSLEILSLIDCDFLPSIYNNFDFSETILVMRKLQELNCTENLVDPLQFEKIRESSAVVVNILPKMRFIYQLEFFDQNDASSDEIVVEAVNNDDSSSSDSEYLFEELSVFDSEQSKEESEHLELAMQDLEPGHLELEIQDLEPGHLELAMQDLEQIKEEPEQVEELKLAIQDLEQVEESEEPEWLKLEEIDGIEFL